MEQLGQVPATAVNWLYWVGFGLVVVFLLLFDLVVFHRRIHAPSLKEAAGWTVFWIGLALIFNGFIWWWRGPRPAVEFLTGYLVEKSLSMDNIFVFAVIFRYFQVELKYQYRILFWGVLGAILMRLAFILLGAELVHRFAWTMPLFGAFLIYTSLHLAFGHDKEIDPERNWFLRLGRRYLRVAHNDYGQRFFVREGGRACVTSLFLVLIVIETTDVLFAVDSVPAIFGVTKDSFTIFTSNIFAILGLRALYFVLASVIDLFCYLVYGLSAVLFFIGAKMIAEHFVPHATEHLIPMWLSLAVVAGLIGVSVLASVLLKRPKHDGPAEEAPPAHDPVEVGPSERS